MDLCRVGPCFYRYPENFPKYNICSKLVTVKIRPKTKKSRDGVKKDDKQGVKCRKNSDKRLLCCVAIKSQIIH